MMSDPEDRVNSASSGPEPNERLRRIQARMRLAVALAKRDPLPRSAIDPLARIVVVRCTAMAETPERIDDGIWRWTARHPEWHPAGFGDEVASFALTTDAELLLIDPLLPTDPAPIHELVDAEAGESGIAVLITIPYHVRDAERLRREHGTRCTIWGHEACVSRLEKRAGFHAITPQTELPAGVRAHAIGSPRRQEQPLWIPSHKALAFGDAVIETGGRLRVWEGDLDSERRTRWYRDRFVPTLKPLLDLGPERVLVTHGDPILDDGRAKLSSALRSKPWNPRGAG